MRTRDVIGLAVLGLSLAAMPLCQVAWSGVALNATVCQLGVHGAEFDGKYVRLKAIYLTDLQHFTFFKDPACPRAIIDEDEPRGARIDHSLKRFNEAVVVPAGGQRVFAVEISGRFHWQKNWQPSLLLSRVVKPGPRGVLVVERVWSFKRVLGDWKNAK